MCCCDKPTINGEFGYKWNEPTGPASVRPVNPPEIQEGDEILFDEPGRCGGIDSHCHHYRLVTRRYSGIALLVRHGGGDDVIPCLSNGRAIIDAMRSLDSNGRYWLLNAMYHTHKDAAQKARVSTTEKWETAAAEKRIHTRKYPARNWTKVWIEEAI
jgi:hypothetical protein